MTPVSIVSMDWLVHHCSSINFRNSVSLLDSTSSISGRRSFSWYQYRWQAMLSENVLINNDVLSWLLLVLLIKVAYKKAFLSKCDQNKDFLLVLGKILLKRNIPKNCEKFQIFVVFSPWKKRKSVHTNSLSYFL